MMEIVFLAISSLLGATLAGTTGFGGAAILLPVLVHFYGVRDAIPILTVAQLVGNGSRVWFNRTELNWRVVGWFALGAVPMSWIGGHLFARTSSLYLFKILGVFLLMTVLWRRLKPSFLAKMPIQGFAGVGALFGFLSAILGSVGPFIVPFFLGFGLIKGMFISTEAMCTVVMHIFKLIAYRQTSLLSAHTVYIGLALGPMMIFGSWLGKQIVSRLSNHVFIILVEIILVVTAISFLFKN